MDTHSNNSLNNSPSDHLPIAQEISNPENAAEIREGGQVEESDDLPIAQGDLDNVDEDQEFFIKILDLDDHRSAEDICAAGKFEEGGQVDEEDEFLQLLTAPPSENDKRLVEELLVVSEQSCVRSPLGSVVEGGSNWFDHCYVNPDRVDPEPHQFDHEDDIFGDDVDFDELRHLLSDDEKNRILTGVHEQQEGGQIPVSQDESGDTWAATVYSELLQLAAHKKEPNKTWSGVLHFLRNFTFSSYHYQTRKATLLLSAPQTNKYFSDFMESVLVSSSSSSHEDASQSQICNNGVKRRKTEQTFGAQGSQALTCNISEGRAVETPSHQAVSSMPQTSSSFQQGIMLLVYLVERLEDRTDLEIKVVSGSTTIAEVTEQIRDHLFDNMGHNIPLAQMFLRPHKDGAEQLAVEDDSADLADHLTLEDIGTKELDLIVRRTN